MTKEQILSELQKHSSIKPFQTINCSYLSVYRSYAVNGNYSVSLGNAQIAGGRIPKKADPNTFPLTIARSVVEALED